MALCFSPDVYVEVVRLLLEAGADAALASEHEITPLNMVAEHSDTRMVDILHTEAPATLNRCSSNGMTPLCSACKKGHEGMVSKLLSLGAMQPRFSKDGWCPLSAAVENGHVGVVRVLMTEGGITAVGGEAVWP